MKHVREFRCVSGVITGVIVLQLRSFTSSVMVRTSWWSTTCCWIVSAKSNKPATPEVSHLQRTFKTSLTVSYFLLYFDLKMMLKHHSRMLGDKTMFEFKTCSVACVMMRFLFASTDNGEKGCTRLEKCSSPSWTCCHTNQCNAWTNYRPGISESTESIFSFMQLTNVWSIYQSAWGEKTQMNLQTMNSSKENL